MDVVLGLGGNVGDPPSEFERACSRLAQRHRVVMVSSFYRSRPIGPSQPDFFNQAVLLEVEHHPIELLEECQAMEAKAGRDRATEVRWGPRPLDIDLLLSRGVIRRGPRLELPHPRLVERAFALVPAAEIVPAWIHPIVGRTIRELAGEASERDPGAVWRVEKSKRRKVER
jgi:2-amino-4-hydroxy-6-hydroxymethyldihydropteridine diphosphokinase